MWRMHSHIIRLGLASGAGLLLLTALPTAAAAAGPGIQQAGYATSSNQQGQINNQQGQINNQQGQINNQQGQNNNQQGQNNNQGNTGHGTVTPELPSGVLFAVGLLPLLVGAGLMARRRRSAST